MRNYIHISATLDRNLFERVNEFCEKAFSRAMRYEFKPSFDRSIRFIIAGTHNEIRKFLKHGA